MRQRYILYTVRMPEAVCTTKINFHKIGIHVFLASRRKILPRLYKLKLHYHNMVWCNRRMEFGTSNTGITRAPYANQTRYRVDNVTVLGLVSQQVPERSLAHSAWRWSVSRC